MLAKAGQTAGPNWQKFLREQLQLVGQLRFRIQKNIKRELVLKIIFLLKK